MFEHMKNYEVLLKKVASWLRPTLEGTDPSLLFIHIFCHRTTPYHFEESDGWMAQMFFSGGTMPSLDMLVSSLVEIVMGVPVASESRSMLMHFPSPISSPTSHCSAPGL